MEKIFVLRSNVFGEGDEDLGEKLMGAFLKKIWARDEKPEAIIFYNAAVKLLAKGSMVLDVLDGLDGAGIELLACGTCIDHYDLKDKIVVGHVSNMEEIVDYMMKAKSVVTV